MRNDHFTFTAGEGARIFVYRWRPDVGIGKAVVHIAHGLAEHAGRYERLAESMTENGYMVYANDHRGHGRTVRAPEEIGHFGDHDGWDRVVKDVAEMCRAEKSEHAKLPLILFGHSLGSQMAQQAIYEYPDLFFDNFNKAFKPNRTAFDWLSRDEREVDKYIADPLCGFIASTQLWVDMLDGMTEIAKPENRARVRKDLPIYLFSGGDDQVNDNGRGCEALAEDYRGLGLKNVNYKIYPLARHETLNEINHDEVTQDLIEWLDAVVKLLGSERERGRLKSKGPPWSGP